MKPFIYLTALDKYEDYTLTTILDDSKLSLISGGEVWEPDNFDKKFHGEVPLHVALWQSYNIASARLGLELGYEAVEEVFSNLGIEKKFLISLSFYWFIRAFTISSNTSISNNSRRWFLHAVEINKTNTGNLW